MSIEAMSKCELCRRYVTVSKEGRAAHMKQYHGVIVQREPMTQAQIDAATDRMEAKLGRQHFFRPSKPIFYAHTCSKCGPTNADGYWLMDKTGICEPCLRAVSCTIEPIEPTEEIQ